MNLSDFSGRSVVVLGLGIDTLAMLERLVAAAPGDVCVVDANPSRAHAILATHQVDAPVFERLDDAPAADVLVRSPGYPRYAPEVTARVSAGTACVTPTGLWIAERADAPMIGVTGTKGKSSTTMLVGSALGSLGHDAFVLGNIGTPAWAHAPDRAGIAVAEISSYQAVDLTQVPALGVLTAIGEDHVDWHGSVAQYHRDKSRMFRTEESRAQWAATLDDVELPEAFRDIDFVRIAAHDERDIRIRNARLAAAVALTAIGSNLHAIDDLAHQITQDYPQLPGRFDTLATIDGIEFVDDALASNPLGLQAAIESIGDRPVTVIVGGRDRGASLDAVCAAVSVRQAPTNFVCIDDAADRAGELAAAGATVAREASLEGAVAYAFTITAPGGVVVFAPGMPTPSAQGNWETRSARFAAAVQALVSAPRAADGR